MFIGIGVGTVAATAPVPDVSGGAANIFPDPDLEGVDDASNGWELFNFEGGTLTPTGGTGPGLSFAGVQDCQASLVGDAKAAFIAQTADSTAYTVRVTIEGFSVGGLLNPAIRGSDAIGGLNITGNGVFEITVLSGTDTTGGLGALAILINDFSGSAFRLARILVMPA